MKVVHNTDKYNEDLLINCDKCPEKFINFDSLMKHVNVHKKNDNFICDNCDKVSLL